MRKTTIIIISLISAFVLMSGGYGYWQKPLIITGKIKVVEPPPPPKVEVTPINAEILTPTQPVNMDPEVIGNPEESKNVEIESVEANDDTADNLQDKDSMPTDQPVNTEEENPKSTEQVQDVKDENSEDISTSTTEAGNEASENAIEVLKVQ